jgi:transcription-repair coupling factor (superfamily II helicase)
MRLPVKTFVSAWNESLAVEAIKKELEREGQVYFVHNRINTILKMKTLLNKIIPQARIAVSHGRLSEEELEKIMLKFINRQYDILLTTTIIEIGLDIPNVNTIIVDDAVNFGLSTLYQLRGRVGRSHRQGYAHLFYYAHKKFSEKAKERLKVIKDFTQLGSGFKIALKDLEIRGAGNIFGHEQHGFINAVGFDEYCDLMAETVKELKGEKIEETIEPEIELGIPSFIPQNYVEDERERIVLYKRILNINNNEEILELQKEFKDRFGDFPQELNNLWKIIEIRIEARELKITKISRQENLVVVNFVKGKVKSLKLEENQLLERLFQHLSYIKTKGTSP